MKIYNNFTDKYGNQYGFNAFLDFAKFWFNISRKQAKIYFPDNFDKLQNCATKSKEARTPVKTAIFAILFFCSITANAQAKDRVQTFTANAVILSHNQDTQTETDTAATFHINLSKWDIQESRADGTLFYTYETPEGCPMEAQVEKGKIVSVTIFEDFQSDNAITFKKRNNAKK